MEHFITESLVLVSCEGGGDDGCNDGELDGCGEVGGDDVGVEVRGSK